MIWHDFGWKHVGQGVKQGLVKKIEQWMMQKFIGGPLCQLEEMTFLERSE